MFIHCSPQQISDVLRRIDGESGAPHFGVAASTISSFVTESHQFVCPVADSLPLTDLRHCVNLLRGLSLRKFASGSERRKEVFKQLDFWTACTLCIASLSTSRKGSFRRQPSNYVSWWANLTSALWPTARLVLMDWPSGAAT